MKAVRLVRVVLPAVTAINSMKTINETDFTQAFSEALQAAHFNLRDDVVDYLNELRAKTDGDHKKVVDIFIENQELSKKENRAICQDTGYVQLFLTIGNQVHLDFDIKKAAEETVSATYQKQFLRKSMAHPLTRVNTGTNTPVFFDIDLKMGDSLDAEFLIKGGGSENVTRAGFLLPTSSKQDVINWVDDALKSAGAKGCPPYLVGVGIGGNLEKAVRASKKLLLKRKDESQIDRYNNELAEELKKKLNEGGVGFQGLRFGETVMSVKVETIPCHIATLPIAVSLGCNAVRQGKFSL